jgi:catalase
MKEKHGHKQSGNGNAQQEQRQSGPHEANGILTTRQGHPVLDHQNLRTVGNRNFEEWEREELVKNLSTGLAECPEVIQNKMIEHFTAADSEYGRRVREALGKVY